MHVQPEHELAAGDGGVLGADRLVARAGVERPGAGRERVRAGAGEAEAAGRRPRPGRARARASSAPRRRPRAVRRGDDLELRGRHLELEARVAAERARSPRRACGARSSVSRVEQHQLLLEADGRRGPGRVERGPQLGGAWAANRARPGRVGRGTGRPARRSPTRHLRARPARGGLLVVRGRRRLRTLTRRRRSEYEHGPIDLERRDLLRTGERADQALLRGVPQDRAVQPAQRRRPATASCRSASDPETGDEVPFDQIVKGFELTKDRYVVITPDELDALDPERTRTIQIEDFVDQVDIDPIYYDHPYYLVPDKGAAKAYGLLLNAMEASGKVAIARVVHPLQGAARRDPPGRRAADDGDDDLPRRGRPARRARRPAGLEGPQGLRPRGQDGPAAHRLAVRASSTRPSTATSTATRCSS